MAMKYISSADNGIVKLAVKLADKKNRDRESLFFVEGRNLILEVIKQPELVYALFIDESREDEYQDLISAHCSLPWYCLKSQLIKRVCATETPQGIAAIVRKPRWSWEQIIGENSLLLLLDQIADPGNMGTIIRTAWAFGVDGILLTRGCVDPYGAKVVRSTMGGILNVPLFETSPDQLASLKDKGYIFLGADVAGKCSFYDMVYTKPTVIVIGNEAKGISAGIKQTCNYLFRIPINSGTESLNAAVACAIIIQAAYRQRHPC
ncbi:MAG: TrmH family RNA methyltransferase [Syntrophomonadaceae bacterium]|jgi:TrmH family RNA methyltransferase